jgi:L-asparaginase II
MLGALKACGWPSNYLLPEHPLQQRIISAVRELAGEQCPTAGDGCGLPTFWLSLEGMARAWAWLALCVAEPQRDPVLARIGRAMSKHPWLISGDGHLDVALSERACEPWISKVGALAVYNIALPSRRLGIAVKVATGDEAALGAAVPALVERIAPGALGPAHGGWPWTKVGNVVGREVGRRLVTGLDRV